MKTLLFMLTLMVMAPVCAQENNTIAKKIIGMEKAALERWNQGDPSGFLELSDTDVVYFDPMTPQRLDGLDKLTALYEAIRGKVHASRYEMGNPCVQAVDSMAVLTYNLVSYAGLTPHKWNCTEVYRLDDDNQWRIIQTHWSFTQPRLQK
ncbi:YybH family protein [Microbacter margulisiae]|uniref:Ketosteroid isomerase-like protein n=1 Tax=Microbacter margulisiae TaxID=1350067 RepID=A0A7W5H1L5_9PORP|nr:nuclear transport factor 2 family protein [Microbacter margulisiae]MBB3186815.1 ketosteroid isomerase-like protein [Microbacter margulisiae]